METGVAKGAEDPWRVIPHSVKEETGDDKNSWKTASVFISVASNLTKVKKAASKAASKAQVKTLCSCDTNNESKATASSACNLALKALGNKEITQTTEMKQYKEELGKLLEKLTEPNWEEIIRMTDILLKRLEITNKKYAKIVRDANFSSLKIKF